MELSVQISWGKKKKQLPIKLTNFNSPLKPHFE